MQIIQSIREKGAAIIVVVIALCLIGFILMDSKPGSNNASGAMSTKVGEVDGHNIGLEEFNKRVAQVEQQQEARSGQKVTTQQTYSIREQVWNQLVAENVFFDEAKKLGIELTSKELSAILMSNDPMNPFLQQGLADQSGKLDVAKAQEALAAIKKYKAEDRDQIDGQIVEPLKLQTSAAKYGSLIVASAYYPSWMAEKDTKDAASFANIAFVNIPYSDISDSAVKVTDADVDAYVNKNKELFKQEAGRRISYVTFTQLPSLGDSNAVRTSLEDIKQNFAADTNAKRFVAQSNSIIEFNDMFLPKSKIGSMFIDTIVKQPIGTVYGPYAEQKLYILAKVLGTKELPDSVKARHILIGVNDPQTGQPIRDDASAKKLADSLLTLIKGGADFAELARKYSSDGSKEQGGDLGTFEYGKMVPEFNEFTFTKPVGSKEVVQTQFGYHIIDILAQSNFKPAYKIAFIAREIVPSSGTINNANLEATKASGEKNSKALEAYVAKKGLQLTHVPTLLKENDFSVGQLQDSRAREIVKWAFKAEKGDVSEPFDLGEQFVVATVDEITKKGLQNAATARSGAEPIILKQKKAAIIKAKIGATPTLESAGQAYGKQVQFAGADSSLTFSAQIINNLGIEPKVIGASFNKDFQAKPSPPIEGTNGVYVIKVNSIQQKAADTPEAVAAKAAARLTSIRTQANNWFEGLRKQADIEDKRSEVY